MSLHDNAGGTNEDRGAAEEIVDTPDPTARFNFLNGSLFISDDYELLEDHWLVVGRWSTWQPVRDGDRVSGESVLGDEKTLMIPTSGALKYIELVPA